MSVEKIECKACNDTGFVKVLPNGFTASPQGWFYCAIPGCKAVAKVSKQPGQNAA